MSTSRIYSGNNFNNGNRGYARHKGSMPATRWKASLLETVVLSITVGAVTVILSYMAFSLMWNMDLEASHQKALSYQNRTKAAHASIGDLRKSIEMLGSKDAIDQWAQENQYQLDGYQLVSATSKTVHSSINK